MPTGVALRDPRAQLFAAAERVLARDGVSGLTTRAVTDEADVAKGVLHRHFTDFDGFLVELVRDRIGRLGHVGVRLDAAVGNGTVVGNLADALPDVFTPTALSLLALVGSRDELRARLRETTPHGLPIVTEAAAMLASYLDDERTAGRLIPRTDTRALALALIGTGHLLFVGELGGLPDRSAVEEVVASIVVGAETGFSA